MDLRIDKKPTARGVTHLMYVGDDEAVEKAVGPTKPSSAELAVGAACAIAALQSRGMTRLVTAGIASWVGYRALRTR